jgi:hypothetical protein
MSADNGIYVLKTPNFKTGHSEFRVAHRQAIENIHYPGEQIKYLKMYFGDCEVFTSEAQAMLEASKLYDEIMESDFPIIEYGISKIVLDREFPT